MTIIAAITGGIGSGKTTFSKEVIKRDLKLLDSDKQVAKIYKSPKKEFINFLKKIKLGQAIKKNRIDKEVISKIVFTNKKTRTQLENYIFKIIRKDRDRFIKKHKKQKTKTIFLDIPLLFENKLNEKFDLIISIVSSKKERYKRLKKTKKMSKDMFNRIVKLQVSDLERKNKSHIVIQNNETMKQYMKKINKVLDSITK